LHLRPDKFFAAEVELGYRFKRSTWGCRLATEGSRVWLEQAFGEWNYEKV